MVYFNRDIKHFGHHSQTIYQTLHTMFAVIETGGKQHLVHPGQTLKIEKVEGEVGTDITFDKVLLIAEDDGSKVQIGKPYLEKASVTAKVEEQARDKKIRVVKYKRKVRYKRTTGHRQHFTSVTISEIK